MPLLAETFRQQCPRGSIKKRETSSLIITILKVFYPLKHLI
ncbi:hypothetical protein A225_2932 [Klebsiella michiganensis E718]|nr:hypothetical protein A225_2932 [Klebsiella michiganensis E718]